MALPFFVGAALAGLVGKGVHHYNKVSNVVIALLNEGKYGHIRLLQGAVHSSKQVDTFHSKLRPAVFRRLRVEAGNKVTEQVIDVVPLLTNESRIAVPLNSFASAMALVGENSRRRQQQLTYASIPRTVKNIHWKTLVERSDIGGRLLVDVQSLPDIVELIVNSLQHENTWFNSACDRLVCPSKECTIVRMDRPLPKQLTADITRLQKDYGLRPCSQYLRITEEALLDNTHLFVLTDTWPYHHLYHSLEPSIKGLRSFVSSRLSDFA